MKPQVHHQQCHTRSRTTPQQDPTYAAMLRSEIPHGLCSYGHVGSAMEYSERSIGMACVFMAM